MNGFAKLFTSCLLTAWGAATNDHSWQYSQNLFAWRPLRTFAGLVVARKA